MLAHVPDLNDFVRGIYAVLAPGGVATLEFPHLLRLLEEGQFDTIYHEHFSYFSLGTALRVFAAHGLDLFDVEELPTHGGSLRIYARRARPGAAPAPGAARVEELLDRERAAGLEDGAAYRAFAARAREVRDELVVFLRAARSDGASVPATARRPRATLCCAGRRWGPTCCAFTVDRSPHKQGRFLPGSRIPVRAPDDLLAARPDYVLILPWNLRDEIVGQMRAVARVGRALRGRGAAPRGAGAAGVKVRATPVPGAFLIDLEPQRDERGFFARAFCRDELAAAGIAFEVAQANVAWNRARGTVRGLHYQRPPHAESKLMRCTTGAAFVVLVDLRRDSPAFARPWCVALPAGAPTQLSSPSASPTATRRSRTPPSSST